MIFEDSVIMKMGKPEKEPVRRAGGSYFTSFLNRIGGVLLAPDATFNQIITDRIGFWEPLTLIILLVAIEGAVLASLAYRVFSVVANAVSPLTGVVWDPGFLNVILVIIISAMIIATLVAWVILAGIAHISAKYIFRGEGSFVQLMKLYGYTFVPVSLLILSTVLLGLSWATWPLTLFLNIVATFWIVLLMAVAVKHNYKIDTGKAFISSFIGPMTVWLVVVGGMWAWMWLLIRSLTGGAI